MRRRRRRRRSGRLAPARRTTFERRPLPVRPPRRRVGTADADDRAAGSGRRSGPHLGLRLSVLAVVVVGLFAILLLRLWSIQVIGHTAAESNAIQTTEVRVPVEPPRGSLVARAGQVLAQDDTREVVTLACPSAERSSCPALDYAVISRLAPLLDTSVAQIDASVQSNQIAPYDPAPIAVGVPYSTVAYLYEHVGEFPGVDVSKTYLRTYPQQSLASQVIGYVGDINAQEFQQVSGKRYAKYGYTEQDTQYGQSGLEQQYELALHGKPGVSSFEVNSSGQQVTPPRLTVQPTPGDEIVLNMDFGLEKELTSALDSQILALRAGTVPPAAQPAPWGAAVVLDDRNGDVIAMTSDPSYDDNVWVPEISEKAYAALTPPTQDAQPLANYAISDGSPPGSTFKLATASAALQDGLITPSYYLDDTGSITIGGQTLTNSNGEVLGEVNVTSALTKSSDIFFYTMGELFWDEQQKYGLTPIQDTAASYGLGVPSGIDLPNASSGQVDSPKLREEEHAQDPQVSTAYYLGDNVEMAFGQGETLLTPLEIANAYATFANGGTRYAPEVAAAIVQPSGAVSRIAPKVMDHVTLSPTNYQAILQGLEGVTQSTDGTAYAAFQGFDFSAWNVAGKTGTATITNSLAPTSWFVAFGGPKGRTPEYTVAVEINQAGYGAQASAPVVRDVFDYLVTHGVAKLKVPSGSASVARS